MKTIYNNFEPAVTGRLFVLKRGIASAIGNVVSSGINASTQKDINAENLREAERNRGFQASEAEINRNWQAEQNKQNQLWQESMQDKQNQWNEEMWNKTNEYNSPFAQLQRAKDAGINPNFVLGGSMTTAQPMQSASAPSANLPSGSAPSGSMASLSNSNPWNFGDIADSILKMSQAKKTQEETKGQITFNKFAEQKFIKDLEWSDAQIAHAYADISEINQNIQNLQQSLVESIARVKQMDVETQGKTIDNMFKSEQYQKILENLEANTNWTKEQCKYFGAKCMAEIGLIKANTVATYVGAELDRHRIAEVDSTVSLLATQNEQQRFNLISDKAFKNKERKESLSYAEYENSTTNRVLNGAVKGASALNSLVGAFKILK